MRKNKFISPRYATWVTSGRLRSWKFVSRFFLQPLSKLFHLHPKTLSYISKSIRLGNPSKTVWPMETLPMISRLISGGIWNWSFFQFHRNFYFPYWARRQYNPQDPSFIPRSHNILSINQTHRNWVSISFPGKPWEVSIDPAAAIMPYPDAYTIEMACLENGKLLRPGMNSPLPKISLINSYQLKVQWQSRSFMIEATVEGVHLVGSGNQNIILSVRPFNMEGAAFLYHLEFDKNRLLYDAKIKMQHVPQAFYLGNIHLGDSLKQMASMVRQNKTKGKEKFSLRKRFFKDSKTWVKDVSGMSNASFFFSSCSQIDWQVWDKQIWQIPHELIGNSNGSKEPQNILDAWFPNILNLQLPQPYQDIFFHARSHLLTLWDLDSVTPGSFTYHHFWIRDAAFMMHSLLLVGGHLAVKRILQTFPRYVSWSGRFKSQAGEWDGNGQALWIIGKYTTFTNDQSILLELRKYILKMLFWIKKIIKKNAGLMPAGFSAEHLGTSDRYLWDTFWTMGGLKELMAYQSLFPQINIAHLYKHIHNSVEKELSHYSYYPAAVQRQKDAGMIGSLAAVYPLQLPEYYNKKMSKTLQIIQKEYFFEGCFYQENIHSGINPYLSLHVAEVCLKLGDPQQSFQILNDVMRWSSVAYSFPEAVHTHSKGGAMGDGFHGWAFSEIVALLRNFFILEVNHQVFLLPAFLKEWKDKTFGAKHIYSICGTLDFQIEKKTVKIQNLNQAQALKKQLRFFIVFPDWAKEVVLLQGISKSKKVSAKETGIRTIQKQRLLEIFLDSHQTVEYRFIE